MQQDNSQITELEKKIAQQGEKIDHMLHDLKRIKQYFLWTLIGSVVTFLLPLIAAVVILPIFLSKYLSTFSDLI